PDEVAVSVLIPNERGLDAALAALDGAAAGAGMRPRFDEVNVFLSASETHNRKNVNRSIAESLAGLEAVLERAREAGLGCEAALEAGVESFESSFGELGGCPVPAGATGNIATEDLVSMLEQMGIETGVDLPALLACARRVQEILGRPLGSHTLVAGPVDWRG